MKERISKWQQMEAENNPDAFAYLKEITQKAKAEGKLAELNEAVNFLLNSADQRLKTVEKSIEQYTIYQQMGDLSEVINLAYIARTYFGKTRQWLYQRVKGQTVNGKQASFTASEEELFRSALNDIGMRLSAFASR